MIFDPVPERRYSLIDEPWIQVVMNDGSKQEVSLRTLFNDVSSISRLDGDSVTQDICLLRIITAICYDALDPVIEESWMDYYQNGLPSQKIIAYLDQYEDRFWLFHPTHPFMQQYDLKPKNEQAAIGASALILKPIGNQELFAEDRGDGIDRMTVSEAARWMLSSLQYGSSGPKSDYADDPYGVQGRSYTTKPLLALMSSVWLSTGSLAKDILMMMIPLDSGFMAMSSNNNYDETSEFDQDEDDPYAGMTAGIPAWRKDPLRHEDGDKDHKLHPRTILDALTWPGRRARLYLDDDGVHVSKAFLAMGLPIDLTDDNNIEPLALWKTVKEGKGSEANEHKTTIQYSTDKSLWRGLTPMVAVNGDQQGHLSSMTLQWASRLNDRGIFNDDYLTTIRVVTVRYDVSYSARITEILDDTVHIPVSALSDPTASQKISDAISIAESAAKSYGLFVWRCRQAMGEDAMINGERDRERSSAYSDMESPFYEWVTKLSISEDPLDDWFSIIRKIIISKAEKYMSTLPTSALYGRHGFSSAYDLSLLRSDIEKIGGQLS
jgi:CRISPR system Cascade subunit CasA